MSESRKRMGLWIAIWVSCLPIAALLVMPSMSSLKSAAFYISAITGYVGIILLLWMYILGAKSVMGLVFTDLAPVLSIHKKLGKWGSLFILLHPALITYSYGEAWFYSFIPLLGTEFERHVTLGRIAFGLIIVTWVLSVLLRKKLGYRPWRYLHYLAYICVPFSLLHVPEIGSQYLQHAGVKVYFFLLTMSFLIFSYLRAGSLFNFDKHAYIIKGNRQISGDDYILWLSPLSKVIVPQRGQYVYIKTGYISEDHPFSITQYNDNNSDLYITYRVFGEFTKYLATRSIGQRIFVGGPFGSFTKEIDIWPSRPVVYIAGGIGITPFIERILRENTVRVQWLFAANRTPESAVFVSILQPLLGSRCVTVYNEGHPQPLPNEETGFLSGDILQKYLIEPSQYDFYICGPPPMMTAVTTLLHNMRVPESQVHTEKFGW